MEPDPYLKQAYEFGVLEDFDHLYRYANLYEMIEHRKAEKIVDGLTEVMPGRPTTLQHRHPFDNVRDPYDKDAVDPLSKLHALTIMSAEQQTMNFYMNVGPQYMEPIARQLYQEIGLIEQEHVTHYESLLDPGENWWERLVNHEYNECYLYYSFMQQETDPRGQGDLGAAPEHGAGAPAAGVRSDAPPRRPGARAGGRARSCPNVLTFEPNKEYLRDLLATQIDLTTLGAGYVREAHERFERMQDSSTAARSRRASRSSTSTRGVRRRVPHRDRGPAPAARVAPAQEVRREENHDRTRHARRSGRRRRRGRAAHRPARARSGSCSPRSSTPPARRRRDAFDTLVTPARRPRDRRGGGRPPLRPAGSADGGEDMVDDRLAEERQPRRCWRRSMTWTRHYGVHAAARPVRTDVQEHARAEER